MAEEIIKEFERCCENASLVQEQLLESILELNKGVEYLRKYDPEGKLNAESFKSRIPLVSYDDIAAYVERIADGDKSPILSNDPVISFSLSSGTSGGRPKIIPETARCALSKGKSYNISTAYRNRLFPSSNANETGLAFFYAGKQFETKSGLKIGAGTTNYFRSDAFLVDNQNAYASPKEVVLGYDWRESTYCHLLCGLLQRDKIDYIIAIFAFTIVEAVRMLAKEYRDLCHDLRTGTLNQDKVTDINMRNAVLKILQPDPELADFVSQVCERKSLNGILQQLWPKAHIQTVGTGAMRPYIPALQEFSGELQIVYLNYASSEASIGINMKPDSDIDDVSFTVVPDSFYFEFIPLQSSSDDEEDDEDQYEQEAPVGVGGVEIGKSYEVVVTSIAGLYRYKLGDVVKITGFFHKSPQLAFSRRKSAVLSINTDKTDEEELQTVMIKASREANIQVSDFTSHGDLSSEPGHYIIYWELVNADDYCELEKLESCCAILDRSFNNPYMRGRAAGTIGALELVIVKQGTFSCLLDLALSRGTSPGQYKTPRCTNSVRVLKLLDDAATARFKSPGFPSSVLQSWKPTFNSLDNPFRDTLTNST